MAIEIKEYMGAKAKNVKMLKKKKVDKKDEAKYTLKAKENK